MKEVEECNQSESNTACESNNTMTLEQFTDIVLASEGINNELAKNDSKQNEEKLTPTNIRWLEMVWTFVDMVSRKICVAKYMHAHTCKIRICIK